MKARIIRLSILGMAILFSSFAIAQGDWPRVINASDGTVIKMYQPEPESFSSNVLKFRSAISVTEPGHSDPIFGTFWAVSKVQTDRDNRQVGIESLHVSDIKIPAETDQNKIDFIKTTLESQIPLVVPQIPLDELLTTLEQNQEQAKLSNNINNKPPRVIYTTQPSILVFIDGEPKLQMNKNWGVDVVVNSPYTIIKNTDNRFYLFGGHLWYVAPSAVGPYAYTSKIPENISEIGAALNKNNASDNNTNANNNANDNVISNIIVSSSPAELIQSQGEPNFTPIQGTGLLYVKNSDNDIFMDVNSQQYYVLISGRWFRAKDLESNQWEYIAADKLPADFANIPEGSPKDNVLASVAGTDAAREAVMDAQIPQTAKIDRNSATTTVTYNGEPQFQSIDGTELEYAVNTASTVLRSNGLYYALDNGVWFVSNNPDGPWSVSTDRPDEVDLIPPSSPVYNSKYVYVYDATPDYVYMGYTPGYLNSYVYGPTVVYGTGYYYNPWYSGYYYPRPWSWGFNVGYNPWYGWSFGFGYSTGWFNVGIGFYGGYHGGWWGPSVYHPAYYGWGAGYHASGGYYGRNAYTNRSAATTNIRVNNTNNIYRGRSGVASRSNRPISNSYVSNRQNSTFTRPVTNSVNNYNRQTYNNPANSSNRSYTQSGLNRTNTQSAASRPNNVFSDRQGNVYQRSTQGWQQRSNRSWAPVDNTQRPDVVRNLDRQQQMRDRGQVRTQNFQSARSSMGGGRPSAAAPRTMSSGGGGGGGRSSGGGGGGGRSSGGGGGSRSGRR